MGQQPASVSDLLHRGFEALNASRPREAAEYCRQALAAAPDLVEGHFLVGLVALELKDRPTAINAFGSVTRLQPDHGAAWAQLARLFMRGGQPARADKALAEAVRAGSDQPVVQDLIGTVFSQLGEQAEAKRWYERAFAAAPDNPAYGVNLASSLTFLGETAAAEAMLSRVIEGHPDNAQAHWLLANTRKATDRRHVEVMVRLLARPNLPPAAQAFLYYGLGKELEDLEEWPRAFAAFSRGAAVKRATVELDEAREAAAYAVLEARYTSDWLASRPPGAPDPAPIFVVGQPRTGTTLVERIITSHSAVRSAGELQQFGLSLRRLLKDPIAGRFAPELMERAADLEPRAVGDAYLAATAHVRGGALRFVDKLPSNFLYVPLILAALPNARVVHLVRDPMDACFASFKQLFADAYPHSYEQGEMARHFARYHRLMATWRERFPGRFFDIEYEAVARDLEPNARALIDYLGLPWEDACLEFHRQHTPVATASAVQVREPAHTRSIGRWRRYESELEPMRSVLRAEGVLD